MSEVHEVEVEGRSLERPVGTFEAARGAQAALGAIRLLSGQVVYASQSFRGEFAHLGPDELPEFKADVVEAAREYIATPRSAELDALARYSEVESLAMVEGEFDEGDADPRVVEGLEARVNSFQLDRDNQIGWHHREWVTVRRWMWVLSVAGVPVRLGRTAVRELGGRSPRYAPDNIFQADGGFVYLDDDTIAVVVYCGRYQATPIREDRYGKPLQWDVQFVDEPRWRVAVVERASEQGAVLNKSVLTHAVRRPWRGGPQQYLRVTGYHPHVFADASDAVEFAGYLRRAWRERSQLEAEGWDHSLPMEAQPFDPEFVHWLQSRQEQMPHLDDLME